MRPKDEQKLTAIIAATLALAHEKGLAGIKMGELARRAGIATGSLYTYFADKQDLLLSVNRHVRAAGADHLRLALSERGGVRERLQTMVGYYADYVGHNREALVFADLLKRSPYMTDTAAAETVEQYAFLQELISEGQSAGLIRIGDPEQLLHVMDGIVKSLIDFQEQKGKAYGPKVRAACQDMVWNAIREK